MGYKIGTAVVQDRKRKLISKQLSYNKPHRISNASPIHKVSVHSDSAFAAFVYRWLFGINKN